MAVPNCIICQLCAPSLFIVQASTSRKNLYSSFLGGSMLSVDTVLVEMVSGADSRGLGGIVEPATLARNGDVFVFDSISKLFALMWTKKMVAVTPRIKEAKIKSGRVSMFFKINIKSYIHIKTYCRYFNKHKNANILSYIWLIIKLRYTAPTI